MTTEDIRIPNDESWVELAAVNNNIVIHNGSNIEYKIRLGSTSTSYGMVLTPNGTVVADESVFISTMNAGENISGSLRVTR